MARIICDYCGTEYEDIQQRCPLCGSINQSQASADGAARNRTRRNRRETAEDVHSKTVSSAKRSKHQDDDRIPKWLTIMICVVLGLAVVIGALYAMYAVGIFSGKKEETEQIADDNSLTQEQVTGQVNGDDEQQTEEQTSGVGSTTEVLCTGVTLSPKTVTVESAGLATTVTAQIQPADCTEEVTWTSSDLSVCTVDSLGVITAVDGGTATVTATCGAFSAEVEVICDFSNSQENNAYLSMTDFRNCF